MLLHHTTPCSWNPPGQMGWAKFGHCLMENNVVHTQNLWDFLLGGSQWLCQWDSTWCATRASSPPKFYVGPGLAPQLISLGEVMIPVYFLFILLNKTMDLHSLSSGLPCLCRAQFAVHSPQPTVHSICILVHYSLLHFAVHSPQQCSLIADLPY